MNFSMKYIYMYKEVNTVAFIGNRMVVRLHSERVSFMRMPTGAVAVFPQEEHLYSPAESIT